MIQNEIRNGTLEAFKDYFQYEYQLPKPPDSKTGKKQSDEWKNRRYSCSLKDVVLNTVLENDGLKLPDLFKKSKWDNYESFKSEVSRFCKNGYVVKSGQRRNYRYYISEKGKENAMNPTYELNNYYKNLSSRAEKLTSCKIIEMLKGMDDASLHDLFDRLLNSVDFEAFVAEAVQDDYYATKEAYSSLRNDVDTLQQQIKNLVSQKDMLASSQSKLFDENKILNENVVNYKNTVSNHEKALSIAEDKLSESEKQIEAHKTELTKATIKIEELEVDVIDKDGKIESLESDIDELNATLADKDGEIASYEEKKIETNATIKKHEKSLEENDGRANRELTFEHNNLKAEYRDVKRQLTESTSSNERKNKMLEQMAVDVAALEATIRTIGTPEGNEIIHKAMLALFNKNASKTNRKSLTDYYIKNKIPFDFEYFDVFKKVIALVKGENVIKNDTIEIISKSNPEFSRGHVKSELTPTQILKHRFYPTGQTENGVYVMGNGMVEPQFLKY